MKLRELFSVIDSTAKEIGASTPFLVGGMVRDIVMHKFENIKDIDITCGDASSDELGRALVKKIPQATYTNFSDGHGRLSTENFNIDFSNNFNVSNIDGILKGFGYLKAKPIEKEVYSRDFTCNSLLLPLTSSKVYDLTNRGIKDIKSKILDTCLAPEITLQSDPKRIVRVIYLCAKLDFKPSPRVVEWVKNNTKLMSSVEKKYADEKLNKAIELNPKVVFDLAEELNMNQFIPNSAAYRDFAVENPEILLRTLNGQ